MITALTTLLVLVSLGLVITPVALATPGEWKTKRHLTSIQGGYFVFNCCCTGI
jgi:hypothetical protein